MEGEGGGLDLFVAGAVFLDIVFTGLPGLPAPGAETWAAGMGSSPGGSANLAVAAARLGLDVGLGTAFSRDVYGDFCTAVLGEQEGVDLSPSRRFEDWHSPVTVSLAYGRDRSMITHGHPLPVGRDGLVGHLPATRSAYVNLADGDLPWVRRARAAGAFVVAGAGWDATAKWPDEALDRLAGADAFLVNSVEAMRYTRADSPHAALRRLAARVPLAVVTRGPEGALAIDSGTGEVVRVPGIPLEALDPTGAGDVFTAGFIAGTLWDLPLAPRLAFANLVAALSVRHFGGSLSAPGWQDIAQWWSGVRRETADADTLDRYAFVGVLVRDRVMRAAHRATATITWLPTAA
jgi:sugar/nucleoside kinase (ribokinase family)